MKFIAPFILCLTLMGAGCISGPLRYKTLGNYNYGTVEFTKRATPIAKPFAAIGGLVTDAGLIVTDTVATPIIAIPYSIIGSGSFGSFGMGNNSGGERVCLSAILIPFAMFELGYGHIDETMGFGREAIWLSKPEEIEPKETNTEQAVPPYAPQAARR